MTGPTAQQLFDHLGDQLTAADWAWAGGRTFIRPGGVKLALGYRELDVVELPAGDSTGGPDELLHAVVFSVEQATAVLRAAGYLPAAEPTAALSVVIQALEENRECCCEFVDIGVGWQKVAEDPECPHCTALGLADRIVTELVQHGHLTATDPGWSRRPDGPAVQMPLDPGVEVTSTRAAGWAWRCSPCDSTNTGMDERTARAQAANHQTTAEHQARAAGVAR